MLNPVDESDYLPTNCGQAAWIDGVPICRLSVTPCKVYYGRYVECVLEWSNHSAERLAASLKKARGETE